jgi:hypothetical protein
MQKTQMVETLVEKGNKLRDELLSLEKEFNTKKEEFLKIQGALEALDVLSDDVMSDTDVLSDTENQE